MMWYSLNSFHAVVIKDISHSLEISNIEALNVELFDGIQHASYLIRECASTVDRQG